MAPLRVLVVATDPLARAGLSALLADEPGIEVAGRSDGADWHADLAAHRPDVVVWDAGWQNASGWDWLGEIAQVALLLFLFGDEGDALTAWTAGAHGVLSRSATGGQMAAAVAALVAGLAVTDSSLADRLRTAGAGDVPPLQAPLLAEPLTPRELQVLRLMADGLPNKAIADRLQISEHTVKFHVNAVLGKLSAASRTEAVVTATRLGLILL